MIPYDIETLCEQNKLTLNKDEKSFVSEFFTQRNRENTVLDTVIPCDLPQKNHLAVNKDTLREDKIYQNTQAILNQAPDTESGYFKVPKVKA